jgi:hypothetical protein
MDIILLVLLRDLLPALIGFREGIESFEVLDGHTRAGVSRAGCEVGCSRGAVVSRVLRLSLLGGEGCGCCGEAGAVLLVLGEIRFEGWARKERGGCGKKWR